MGLGHLIRGLGDDFVAPRDQAGERSAALVHVLNREINRSLDKIHTILRTTLLTFRTGPPV